jgi:hypothetical protein
LRQGEAWLITFSLAGAAFLRWPPDERCGAAEGQNRLRQFATASLKAGYHKQNNQLFGKKGRITA